MHRYLYYLLIATIFLTRNLLGVPVVFRKGFKSEYSGWEHGWPFIYLTRKADLQPWSNCLPIGGEVLELDVGTLLLDAFIVVCSVYVAALPLIYTRWKFSLRLPFIVTTVVAAAFALYSVTGLRWNIVVDGLLWLWTISILVWYFYSSRSRPRTQSP